jgi:ATP synthase protein I
MKRKILQFEGGKLESRIEEVSPKDNREDKKRFYKTLSSALSLGTSIVLPIVGGVLLGRYLDTLFSTAPIATILLLTLGVIASFYTLIRLTRDIS